MRIALLSLALAGCVDVVEVWDRVVQDPAPPEPTLTSVVAPPPAPSVLPVVAPAARDASLIGLAEVLPDVSERAVQSVVSVANPRTMSGGQGLGSGVVLTADGIVVTNNHVIEGSDEVIVALNSGEQQRAAVLGTDPKTDLAVLRLSDPPDDLVPLPFGDSDDLRLGEVVLAVGTPFGIGQTVTMGIVSAKGRADMGIIDYEDFIQTDAAINPGNSGGALVDLDGTLVGINTAIFSKTGGSQGIGFAIPASMARPIVDAILTEGEVDRGFLGVQIRDLPFDDRESMGLDGGALIAGVQAGTPAAAAGLLPGDVVVEYMGRPVPDAARFRNRVAATGSDRPFEAIVLREGERRTVKGMLTAL